ncbi:sigma-70 family RNA polymerase sigma factor [uncultured Dokdonia sp.]|uniref:RNA polymerase sigma factor n=1 Tax=uncultured Dokdonia sp. TaxID=575653 RepID=UPI0026109977|nr:sigma-70 family RNA polymerase sigma factor [uncultured Dokdonia sp.]
MEPKLIDHLFRHHYGKMVSVLVRIFGLAHLETIEDAIQDTFIKATISWKNTPPEHPEAWLTQAAKNRVLDLFRKLKAAHKRVPNLTTGTETIAIQELFLDTEIEDSQLRMIFTACHPRLNPKDRISFALKTVSGFSHKEIAAALLTKEETIKKRLSRARTVIQREGVSFKIPQGKALSNRLNSVMEVLYLIFNEGFHSTKKELLIRKELCAEAMRLCQLLLTHKSTQTPKVYALFAVMCFHAARIDSKTNHDNELMDLRHQNRSLWYFPLVALGNTAMHKAVEGADFSSYHYEAAIAAEHLKASSFEKTNWKAILKWYQHLYELEPMSIYILNMAVVQLQDKRFRESYQLLQQLVPETLGQRRYLYYATLSDYYLTQEEYPNAIKYIDLALDLVTNLQEKKYLEKKRVAMIL